MSDLTVEISYLPHYPLETPPKRATPGSAGVDLIAAIKEPMKIYTDHVLPIPTGIAIAPKRQDVVGLVLPRSGLGTKHGIVLANGTGVIDSDYRGEILLYLRNHSEKPYIFEPGEKVAQLIFFPIFYPTFQAVEVFTTPSERGTNGFGSSGRLALEQLIERGIEQLEAQARDLSYTQRLELPSNAKP